MTVKKIIQIMFTIVFVLISAFFLVFQYIEISKDQNETAKMILTKLYVEYKQGELSELTLSNIPKSFFYAIWIKEYKKNWRPFIYDNKKISVHDLKAPNKIPVSINKLLRVYNRKINDIDFVIWINKFNTEFFMKNVILTFLILLLLYFIMMLTIEIFYRENYLQYEKDMIEEDSEHVYRTAKNVISENEPENIEDLIEHYKELWNKNFKISDDFKRNFPFKDLNDIMNFGITPEKYINDSIEIASDYFNWKNPKLYIHQKDLFIESSSKDILDISNIPIPANGTKKGSLYIPLFPYSIKSIYGFFYFEWDKKENFYLSDILFFLKYFFSEKAKNIFVNYKELENIIDIIKKKLDNNLDISISMIEADNTSRLKEELKPEWLSDLDEKVKNNLSNTFKDHFIFKIANFNYGVINNKTSPDKYINDLKNWMNNTGMHNYEMSNEYGNIALTFSCGTASRSNRDLHPLTLINEAEKYLKSAKKKGGNILIDK